MILITGAGGFIGSVLVSRFNEMGRHDLILSGLGEDSQSPLVSRANFVEYIEAFELLERLSSLEIEAIYHMGACSATDMLDREYLKRVNSDYTIHLLQFAFERHIPIVYASSAAVYGDGSLGYSDQHDLTSKLSPLNPYGESKKIVDEWVLSQNTKGQQWFGVRFFNVYGPNEYFKGKMRSVVHQAYQQIKDGGRVKLFQSHHPDYADGEQMRDFVYVKGVVTAMIKMLELEDSSKSGIYNLGTGRAQSFNDLVKATFKALEIEPQIDYIPTPEHLRSQYQYYTQAEMKKFSEVFPEFYWLNVEQGVSDYVLNHLERQDSFF